MTQHVIPGASQVFPLQPVALSTGIEHILHGGRSLFHLLPQAFEGVKIITFIGWGSQAPAQSQNLRDSLREAGSDIVVRVGLRSGSPSFEAARKAGFNEEDGTLGDMFDFIPDSDMVNTLISDGGLSDDWREIMWAMKPGATLGLSHGFLALYLEAIKEKLRDDISVILMAPKGMGNSVRLLYEQGKNVNGAGINSSVAVQQDVDGRAIERALGWAVGTGSPATFFTTMRQEVISDLTGERSMLLGARAAMSEVLFTYFKAQGLSDRDAFLYSAKAMTSLLRKIMSKEGILGLYQQCSDRQFVRQFRSGYNLAHPAMRQVILDLYADVESGKEILEVVERTKALKTTPMSNLEASHMWAVGKSIYAEGIEPTEMNEFMAFAAGVLAAGIMALMQVLREKGHKITEIVNESFIESIDSLDAFMDKRGVAHMVDNCSITARLGARKWRDVFMAALLEQFKNRDRTSESVSLTFEEFLNDPLHGDITVLFKFRPPVELIVN